MRSGYVVFPAGQGGKVMCGPLPPDLLHDGFCNYGISLWLLRDILPSTFLCASGGASESGYFLSIAYLYDFVA